MAENGQDSNESQNHRDILRENGSTPSTSGSIQQPSPVNSPSDANSQTAIENVEFDEEKLKDAVGKMLMIDHLPFKFVENPGFKGFLNILLSTPVEVGSSEGNPFLEEVRKCSYGPEEIYQLLCVVMLERMIIIDELEFEFVEKEGFKQFISDIRPEFEIPTSMIISSHCMELYWAEKVYQKRILSLNDQMVSLTTDIWTSISNRNYLCLTAHFIDKEWKLNRKILNFQWITEDTLDKALEICLNEWEISKICTITVGNGNAHDMSALNGIVLLNGEHYNFLRCCVHILNSIVSDGFKEMDRCISRIRAACKYVRSSLSRMTCFKRCVNEANISYDQMVVVDVPTKWNSTYLMLEVAEKFEKAFVFLESEDDSYVTSLNNEGGLPNADDWNQARAFIKVLRIFYEATLSFSGYLNVSSNYFLRKWVKIQNALRSWIASDDFRLQQIATNMKSKFDQCWDIDGNINNLWFVAIFLDPRFKFHYLEFCFERIYGPENCKAKLEKLKDLIRELFERYMLLHPIIPDTDESSGPSSDVTSQTTVSTNVGGFMDIDKEFGIMAKKRLDEHYKTELERYMKDHVEVGYDGFDVLRWWKDKSTEYYVLAHMARDVLAIPVSSVSFEHAFITGDHVLDQYRSNLHPAKVEALICTKSWLRPDIRKNWESRMFDVVKVERGACCP